MINSISFNFSGLKPWHKKNVTLWFEIDGIPKSGAYDFTFLGRLYSCGDESSAHSNRDVSKVVKVQVVDG